MTWYKEAASIGVVLVTLNTGVAGLDYLSLRLEMLGGKQLCGVLSDRQARADRDQEDFPVLHALNRPFSMLLTSGAGFGRSLYTRAYKC